ncbi:hypothetical protein BKH20_07440 [Actinomyces oris]|uniref:Uncharacterized protein n=1 Tax=Actinomyces oris TaxID=544580 RepID=A0A1Q8WNV1_9ACTO|nr:hypothetical protein BKH20_07440 [Actinomyces oris]
MRTNIHQPSTEDTGGSAPLGILFHDGTLATAMSRSMKPRATSGAGYRTPREPVKEVVIRMGRTLWAVEDRRYPPGE